MSNCVFYFFREKELGLVGEELQVQREIVEFENWISGCESQFFNHIFSIFFETGLVCVFSAIIFLCF